MSDKWSVKGTRVFGYGRSFNCLNKVTAEQLYHTLTTYETTTKNNQSTSDKLDKIEKQLIALKMDLTVVNEDINKIMELLKE